MTAALVAAPLASAHKTGAHTGLLSTVSYIKPQLPGLLVQVLGGHVQLSIANLTRKKVVILNARRHALLSIPPGKTRVWPEPRIGLAGAPPLHEGLIRYWRIPGTADGEPFEIVGFLGYRAPPEAASEDDALPTWAIALGSATGALVLAAGLVLAFRRRSQA